jgi:hypothetical protein
LVITKPPAKKNPARRRGGESPPQFFRYLYLVLDEVRGQRAEPIKMAFCPAVFDRDVLALDGVRRSTP